MYFILLRCHNVLHLRSRIPLNQPSCMLLHRHEKFGGKKRENNSCKCQRQPIYWNTHMYFTNCKSAPNNSIHGTKFSIQKQSCIKQPRIGCKEWRHGSNIERANSQQKEKIRTKMQTLKRERVNFFAVPNTTFSTCKQKT